MARRDDNDTARGRRDRPRERYGRDYVSEWDENVGRGYGARGMSGVGSARPGYDGPAGYRRLESRDDFNERSYADVPARGRYDAFLGRPRARLRDDEGLFADERVHRGLPRGAGEDWGGDFGVRDVERHGAPEWRERYAMPGHRAGEPARVPDARGRDFRGRGPRGWRRSDERLLEVVHERLTDDPDIDASDIEVACSEGHVTLTGRVAERWMKHRAEDMVVACAGVRDVDNRIRVARSPAVTDTDAMPPMRDEHGPTASTGMPNEPDPEPDARRTRARRQALDERSSRKLSRGSRGQPKPRDGGPST